MSRKDFELIASVVRTSHHLFPQQKEQLAQDFAFLLRATNPRFNRQRFIEACTKPEEPCK